MVAKKINRLGNMAAYNPNGAEPPGTPNRDEGYLFWAAWLGHNSNSVFQVQDAHGVDRRIYLTIGCDEAVSLLGSSPLAPAVTGLQQLFAPGAPFAGAAERRNGLAMQKSAPSLSRILIAVGFALSCFLLLLFLWVSFGGPVPLKPESYRITAYFPEATQLATESDVRIGGVSVGKVKSVDLAPVDKQVDGLDTSAAEIEIEPEFAPISSDARAILRQKTLLGETYVELSTGSAPATGRGAGLAGIRRRGSRGRGRGRARRFPRAGRSASHRSRMRPRSTRSSTRSTPKRGTHSSSGSRVRRSRSRVAASTSTTRSATSGRSSAMPRTCSPCSAGSAISCRAWSATPAPSSMP